MLPRNSPWYLFCLLAALLSGSVYSQDGEHTAPLELRHNMPFVQVTINGRGPFTFSIDTGTGGEALVSPVLIEQLDLPVTSETEVGDPSGKNPQKAPVVAIHSLQVAGIEFRDVKAVRFQPSPREGQCDGILGFVLFREYVLTLDYPSQRLMLTSGAIASDGGKTVLPYLMPDHVPTIELEVESQKIAAHLDSRGMGLSLPEKFASGLRFAAEPVVFARGRTVSSDFEIKGATLAGDVRLAGFTIARPFVEINPVFPVANFGAIPLHHFVVSFDQKNKLVRFATLEKEIMIPPPQMRRMTPPAA